MVKKITTCVDDSLWKDAMFKDISWTKALKLGLEMLLSEELELKKLLEEKAGLECKLEHISGKIEGFKIADEAKKKQDKIVLKNLEELQSGAEIISQDIKFLRGRTKSWNKHTGMRLSNDDFYKLCKRFEQGEFKDNSRGKP